MSGTLIEYARFVEVQQRRARISADLKPAVATPAPTPEPKAVAVSIDDSEPGEVRHREHDPWTR